MSEEVLRQAPQIIPVLTDPAGLWVNIVLAFFTFLAVMVALFQDKIKQYFDTAKLSMEIHLTSPDSTMIDITNRNTGERITSSFYMRIKVSNLGSSPARNVEIMPTKFVKIVGNSEVEEVELDNFLPISLVWSHFQPQRNIIRIPSKLFRHCDFGHFIPPIPDEPMTLYLDSLVQPNRISNGDYGNIFQPGKYRFELLLTGDNVKSIKKQWELEFSQWHNDDKLLREKIKLYKI